MYMNQLNLAKYFRKLKIFKTLYETKGKWRNNNCTSPMHPLTRYVKVHFFLNNQQMVIVRRSN